MTAAFAEYESYYEDDAYPEDYERDEDSYWYFDLSDEAFDKYLEDLHEAYNGRIND